ncbi:MAG TPA: LEA type 2 family protein [Gemmatimonadales bacterium]|jgi:LEA14-like dessication related protein|nr:LEA type 2 family protein [Gemmatimonadales bacterium]
MAIFGKTTLGKGDARVALFSVVFSVAVSGCATLKNALTFEKPQIELQEINVTGLGLSGGTLDLVFDVYNPNQYRLRSTRLEVGLELAGTDFGEALIDKPLDLSPENHSRVLMPVRFTWSGVGAAARSLLQSQELPYGLTGAVLLDTPLGERRVQLSSKGNVPLRKLLQ